MDCDMEGFHSAISHPFVRSPRGLFDVAETPRKPAVCVLFPYLSLRQQMRRYVMPVVAIANAKGGSGKTTAAPRPFLFSK